MLKNIKSRFILGKIFSTMRKRIKLMIVKHNKKLMNLLNIKKEDFKDFIILKEISEELNTTIKDIEITKLDLSYKRLSKYKLKNLSYF